MTGGSPQIAIEALFFAGICLFTLAILVYALLKWFLDDRKLPLPAWRRVAFRIGVLLVIFQAVLFAVSWRRDVSDYANFARWARLVLPSFLVAAGCVLAGKGPSRWWLLAVSILLFVLCFLVVLSA